MRQANLSISDSVAHQDGGGDDGAGRLFVLASRRLAGSTAAQCRPRGWGGPDIGRLERSPGPPRNRETIGNSGPGLGRMQETMGRSFGRLWGRRISLRPCVSPGSDEAPTRKGP
jgi:hypothetical protein